GPPDGRRGRPGARTAWPRRRGAGRPPWGRGCAAPSPRTTAAERATTQDRGAPRVRGGGPKIGGGRGAPRVPRGAPSLGGFGGPFRGPPSYGHQSYGRVFDAVAHRPPLAPLEPEPAVVVRAEAQEVR